MESTEFFINRLHFHSHKDITKSRSIIRLFKHTKANIITSFISIKTWGRFIGKITPPLSNIGMIIAANVTRSRYG